MENTKHWEGLLLEALDNPPPDPGEPPKTNADGRPELLLQPGKGGAGANLGARMVLAPGQRPGRITSDQEDPRADPRVDYYTRGSVSRKEFARLARRVAGKGSRRRFEYLSHPFLLKDLNAALSLVRKDTRRRAKTSEIRAAILKHMHNCRWPVLLSRQFIARLLRHRGYAEFKNGWGADLRY